RARCEIDLSPGTRTRPVSAAERRAVSGEAGTAWFMRLAYHGASGEAIDSGLASGQGKHHFSSSSGPFLRISEPWQNPSSARSVSAAVAAPNSTISAKILSSAQNAARSLRSSCRWRVAAPPKRLPPRLPPALLQRLLPPPQARKPRRPRP